MLACAKHFAGYSETQGGRDASESDISPRKLRSWFLPPFEQAAREGARTFMLGYQSIDGVPITANQWLINDVLKGEWGFTGTLVTDWDNVGRMVWEQRVCPDHTHAAAVALNAGNDLIMATPEFFDGAQEAVARGLVAEAEIDAAVRRILRLKFELGLFEDPRAPRPRASGAVIGCAAPTALNLETARRSLVLLRNDGTLPLDGGMSAEPDERAPATGPARSCGPRTERRRSAVVLGDWAGASGQINWMPDGHPRRPCRRCSTASAPSSPRAGASRTRVEPTSRSLCPTRLGRRGTTVRRAHRSSRRPRSMGPRWPRPSPPRRLPTTRWWSSATRSR